MADKTYYAWTPIYYDADVDTQSGAINDRKVTKIGDEVSADSLGVSEEEFKEMVAGGSVRSTPYPEEIDLKSTNLESPAQVVARSARRLMEGNTDEEPAPKSKAGTTPAGDKK